MPKRRRRSISRVKDSACQETRDPNQERIRSLIRSIKRGKIDGAEKVADMLASKACQGADETHFDILADLLDSDDVDVRVAAAACIDYQARRYAGLAGADLGIVHGARLDMPRLFDALRDEKRPLEVRRHLLRALPFLRFGSERDLLPVLLKLLDGSLPSEVLVAAIDALQWCGPDLASAATGHLSELLDHPSYDVQVHACETLEWLGIDGKPAMPALVARVCDDREDSRVRLQAAAALVAIAPAGNELVEILTRDQRETVIEELRRLGKPGRAVRQRLEARRTEWMTSKKIANELGIHQRSVTRCINEGILVPLQITGATTDRMYHIDLDEFEQEKRRRGL